METPELLQRLYTMRKVWDIYEEDFPPMVELDALILELEREHYLFPKEAQCSASTKTL